MWLLSFQSSVLLRMRVHGRKLVINDVNDCGNIVAVLLTSHTQVLWLSRENPVKLNVVL